MSWEHSHYPKAFAVFLTSGCDELPTPDAIFQTEEEANEYIARERVKAMLDDLGYTDVKDGESAARFEGHKPEDYLQEAGTQDIRNLYIPWWNSTDDVPEQQPCPVDEYTLADLVRLNAPEEGEDTLSSVERRLAEWHLRKYGGRVNGPRTFAKLCEELGELAGAMNRCDGRKFEDAAKLVQDSKDVAIEAADMVFVLFHLVRGMGHSLADAINQKLPIIEQRLVDPNAGREPKESHHA